MYQEKKAEIQRMNEENERNLELWIKRFAPHISQTQLSPGIPPPSADQPAKPFYGSSVSDDQGATSVPRPPQYVSPTRGRFDGRGNSSQYQTVPMGPPQLRHQPAAHELSMPLERENDQTIGQDRQNMGQEGRIELRNDARSSTGETKRMECSPKQKRKVRVPKQRQSKSNEN